MVVLSDPVILLQEIEPKKPTHTVKIVGNIKRVRIGSCGGKNKLSSRSRVNKAATLL